MLVIDVDRVEGGVFCRIRGEWGRLGGEGSGEEGQGALGRGRRCGSGGWDIRRVN